MADDGDLTVVAENEAAQVPQLERPRSLAGRQWVGTESMRAKMRSLEPLQNGDTFTCDDSGIVYFWTGEAWEEKGISLAAVGERLDANTAVLSEILEVLQGVFDLMESSIEQEDKFS